jgi:hypothetical protein
MCSINEAPAMSGPEPLEFSAADVYDHDWDHGVPRSDMFTVRFWRREGRMTVRWWERAANARITQVRDVVAVAFYPVALGARGHVRQVYVMSVWRRDVNETVEIVLVDEWTLYSEIRGEVLRRYASRLHPVSRAHRQRANNQHPFPSMIAMPVDAGNRNVQACLRFSQAEVDRITQEQAWARFGWRAAISQRSGYVVVAALEDSIDDPRWMRSLRARLREQAAAAAAAAEQRAPLDTVSLRARRWRDEEAGAWHVDFRAMGPGVLQVHVHNPARDGGDNGITVSWVSRVDFLNNMDVNFYLRLYARGDGPDDERVVGGHDEWFLGVAGIAADVAGIAAGVAGIAAGALVFEMDEVLPVARRDMWRNLGWRLEISFWTLSVLPIPPSVQPIPRPANHHAEDTSSEGSDDVDLLAGMTDSERLEDARRALAASEAAAEAAAPDTWYADIRAATERQLREELASEMPFSQLYSLKGVENVSPTQTALYISTRSVINKHTFNKRTFTSFSPRLITGRPREAGGWRGMG